MCPPPQLLKPSSRTWCLHSRLVDVAAAFRRQPASVSISPTYRTCTSTDSQVPFSSLAVRARCSLHFDKVLVQLILLKQASSCSTYPDWSVWLGRLLPAVVSVSLVRGLGLCLIMFLFPPSPYHSTWQGPWSDDANKADALSFHMPWQVDSSRVQIQKWRAQTVPLSKGSHLGTLACSPN